MSPLFLARFGLLSLVVFGVPRPGKTDRNAAYTNTTILQFVSRREALRSEQAHQALPAHSIILES